MAPLKQWMETYLWVGYRYPEIHSLSSVSLQPGGWSWAVTFLDICPKSIAASDGRCFIIHCNALGRGCDHLSTTYPPWFFCRHTSKSNWVSRCLHFSLAKDRVSTLPLPVVAVVFPGDSVVKNLPPKQEPQVTPSPGRKDPLDEEMATPSSVSAWRIPWTEEPSGLQSIESEGEVTERLHTPPHTRQ